MELPDAADQLAGGYADKLISKKLQQATEANRKDSQSVRRFDRYMATELRSGYKSVINELYYGKTQELRE